MRVAKRPLLAVAIPIVVLATVPAYLRAYTLSGISDAPTLLLGDTAVVNQAAFWLKLPYTQVSLLHVAQPKRGDLVQILRPDRPLLVFKRVIGLPREVIQIRENQVVIDGQPLSLRPLPQTDFSWVPESHHMGNTVYQEDRHWAVFTTGTGEFRNYGPVKLAADEFFLLGDNRDVSLDCRSWGPLKEGAIRGKVIFTMPNGPRRK
jgi:signal peptidase I